MIFGPFNLLFFFFTSAASLAILGGGIYFVWGWYNGIFTGIVFLLGGIAMLLFSFLGRPLMLAFLSSTKSRSGPEPALPVIEQWIDRPNGSRLYVQHGGLESGPTLILTHGLSLDSASWGYVTRSLAARFRLIMWDLPGFGRSNGPTRGEYTLEALAEDLQAVVNLAGDGPVILAGHSMGGMVTLTYRRLFPQEVGARVGGLILAQTTYTNPVRTSKYSWLLTALQRPVLTPLCWLMIGLFPVIWLMNLQNYLSGMAHLNTHLTGFAGVENAEQLEFISRYSIKTSPASTGRAMLALFNYDASDVLAKIDIPTLLITGEKDYVTVPEAGEMMLESIPNATRTLLATSGHLGLVEQYKLFSDALAEWAAACLAGSDAARRSA